MAKERREEVIAGQQRLHVIKQVCKGRQSDMAQAEAEGKGCQVEVSCFVGQCKGKCLRRCIQKHQLAWC